MGADGKGSDEDIGAVTGARSWWETEPITAGRVATSDNVIEGVLREVRSDRPPPRDARPRAAAGRVLVVEDDRDLRELFAECLHMAGSYEVLLACDGADGLRKARAFRPDVIVSDYCMPLVDGGQFAKQLAADASTCDIPVVLVSAHADRVPRDLRLSCAAFIAKPCGPDELTRIVELVIAARGRV